MSNDVSLEVKLATGQAVTAIKKFQTSVDKFTTHSEKSFSKLQGAVNVFVGTFASNVVLRGLSSLNSAVRDSFTEFKNFEKALLEIQTILPKNTSLTKKMTHELIALSTSFGTSQTEQAKAFYQTISAGVTDASDAMGLLDAANKVALGGLGSLESSIDVLTDIVNVYGQENITASDAADTLFQTVKLGKTRISDLSTSLGAVLPLAKQLGISLVEVSAALAKLTTKGQSTSERVTQLRSLFTAIIKKQDTAAKMGGKVAAAFSITALKTKGLSKFLEDLVKVTGGSEIKLQKLLARTEGVNAVLGLTQGGIESFNKTLAGFKDRAGAASEASEKMKKSLDFRLKKASSQFEALTHSIYGLISPAIITGLETVNSLLTSIVGTDKQQKAMRLNVAIESTTRGINNLKEKIKETESGSRGFFSKFFDSRSVKDLKKELTRLEEKLVSLKNTDTKRAPTGELDNSVNTAEILSAKKRSEELKKIKLEEMQTLQAMEDDFKLQKIESEDLGLAEEQLKTNEKLQRIKDALGEEEALRIGAEVNALQRQNKFTEARKKIDKAYSKSKNILDKKDVEYTKKIEKEKFSIRQNKLRASADLLTAFSQLAATQGKKGFAMAKALALASIPINTASAIMNALAMQPPSWANVAAAVAAGVTGAAQLATVMSSKPPAFEQGGIVEGSSFTGDKITARVNSGELILNQAQQDVVADKINGQPIIIEINGREIARAVKDEIDSGFSLMPA